MNGRKKLRKILRTRIYAKPIQKAGTQEMSEIGSVQDVAQFDGPKNRSGACNSKHVGGEFLIKRRLATCSQN